VSTIFFITHPDVAIDPSVPVPDWPLNERGRARMLTVAAWPWASGVRRIFASSEQKARDGAQILADALGLDGYSVVNDLGENDRSATGYLAKQEFEATADAFFAHPQESVRGWEPAVIAEARIICAVEQIVSQTSDDDLAIVGHGGTGTLLYCHLAGLPIDRVFLGSCTNGRIEDLRAAARVVQGRRVASSVRAMVVPGSQQVRAQAEREGLDRVFREAGFEWRNAGCSMCLGMNADTLKAGERCASTSNRNFEGRQGKGGRTHLVSPLVAAATAITGHLSSPADL